jgi:phosphatidylserine decarboxylase
MIKMGFQTDKRRFVFALIILMVLLLFYPFHGPQPVRYINRSTGQIKTEQVMAGRGLFWLYNNPLGELTLQALVKRKFASEWYGKRMDRPASAGKIGPFVKRYHIRLSDFEKKKYTSFNDFFTRKLAPGARIIDTGQNSVISPGDGKILAFANITTQDFIVKGYRFNLHSFLHSDSLAHLFTGGSLLLLRLSPSDYHRFHYPVTGKLSPVALIRGDYYSVNPLAIRKDIRIYCENKRAYQIIDSKRFGKVLMTEVGATFVGSIIQTHHGDHAVKGEEAGYFKFGGSSVVLLFQKGKITIDSDLLKNTQRHLETQVKMGEHIATGN